MHFAVYKKNIKLPVRSENGSKEINFLYRLGINPDFI
jgi:hypothetical protein